MRAALCLGEDAARLRLAQALMQSAIAMIFVVHFLDGAALSHAMSLAYLVVGAFVWSLARAGGCTAVDALRRASVHAWCAALFVGAYYR